MSEKPDISEIYFWLHSRFTATWLSGIEALQKHYLTYHFQPIYLDWVAELRTSNETVNRARASFFAAAMAHYPEFVLIILGNGSLDPWTHRETVKKCRASRRISPAQKEALSLLLREEEKKKKTL